MPFQIICANYANELTLNLTLHLAFEPVQASTHLRVFFIFGPKQLKVNKEVINQQYEGMTDYLKFPRVSGEQ